MARTSFVVDESAGSGTADQSEGLGWRSRGSVRMVRADVWIADAPWSVLGGCVEQSSNDLLFNCEPRCRRAAAPSSYLFAGPLA